MKNFKHFLLTVLVALSSIFIASASDYDFEVDGICYSILSLSDKTVCVSGLTSTGDIIIPDNVSYNSYEFSVESISGLFDSKNTKSIKFNKKINISGNELYGCGTAYYYVDSENPYMTATDGVLYSKDMHRLISYAPHKSGSEFTIPESVTEIDDYSFGANKYLRKLVFNNNIEELPESFIYGTRYSGGLTELILSDKIKVIHGRCLYDMNSLKILKLPKDLEEVEKDPDWGYYGLPTGMTDIIISNSKIANYTYSLVPTLYVFSRFSNLVNFHVDDPNPVPLNDGIFTEGNYFTIKLYVPQGAKETYLNTEGWKNFFNIEEDEPESPIQQSATPTISIVDGKIMVTSGTEGAKCITTVTSADFNKFEVNGELVLSGVYEISSYAHADGYNNSDVVSEKINMFDLKQTTVEVHDTITVEKIIEKEVPVVEYVEVHDTTYIIKVDTVYLEIQVEVPIEVHDTIEVEKIVEVPVEVHDTIEVEKIVEVPVEVHDTIKVEKIVEVPVEVHDTIEVEKVVEVPVEVHDTIYIYDDSRADIALVDGTKCTLYVQNGVVYIADAPNGTPITVCDLNGKEVTALKAEEYVTKIELPRDNVYVINVEGTVFKIKI